MRFLILTSLTFLMFFPVMGFSDDIDALLIDAKPYVVVSSESAGTGIGDRQRQQYFIVSDAETHDELAQTVMRAAVDLQEKYSFPVLYVWLFHTDKYLRDEAGISLTGGPT